jgi:hypothetical protein
MTFLLPKEPLLLHFQVFFERTSALLLFVAPLAFFKFLTVVKLSKVLQNDHSKLFSSVFKVASLQFEVEMPTYRDMTKGSEHFNNRF